MEDELRIRWMDLNLYLGLPRSPRRRAVSDLGSDLALAPADMSIVAESSDPGDAPYSPTLPSYERIYSPTDPAYHPEMPPAPPEDNPPIYEPFDAPYSPSPALPLPLPLPTVEENDELDLSRYAPMSPPAMADRDSPPRARMRSYDDADFDFAQLLSREVGSSSREELSSPEHRFARLIEVNQRMRQRQMLRYGARDGERRDSAPAPAPALAPEHQVYESAVLFGKHDSPAKNGAGDVSDDDAKEKIKAAANFECNICLDMATEPVVTSCGHLFCWPCLYQWLHLHSDHRECPVCKGEVVESNVIPIFGRGSSESSDDSKNEKNGKSSLEIPPRPRGNRFESFRQQFRPISRRLGEGIANSWRRLVDQRIRRNQDPSLSGMYDSVYHRAPLTRMRARRIQREEGIPETPPISRESGLPRDSLIIPQASSSSLLFRDGDPWRAFSIHNLSSTDRLTALAADLGGAINRFGSSTNLYAAAASAAANVVPPEPPVVRAPAPATSAADQASASSTMAVIQGDAAAVDASAEPNSAGSSRIYRRRGRSSGASGSLDVDGALHGDVAATETPTEPNSAVSSRVFRRRGRSSASGSLDVDGGGLHVRKRRRLN